VEAFVPPADAESWRHRDSLDALMAAPGFHRVLFENDAVRVLEARIGPGETVPLHTHRWPSVLYVLASGHHVRRDGEGRVLGDTREAGAAPAPGTTMWITARPPHSVENVDDTEIRLLNVELKHPLGPATA
jgi:mannose-6-phosphate isomerase-like protein (cupin superfamily)